MICKLLLETFVILILASSWSWIQDQANAQDYSSCPSPPLIVDGFQTSMCKDEPMSSLAGPELAGYCFRDVQKPLLDTTALDSCFYVRTAYSNDAVKFNLYLRSNPQCSHQIRVIRVQVFDPTTQKNFGLGTPGLSAPCPNSYPESFVRLVDSTNILTQRITIPWNACRPNCNLYIDIDLVLKVEFIYAPDARRTYQIGEFHSYIECYPKNPDCEQLKSGSLLPPPPTTKTTTIHKFDDDNDIFSGCGVSKFCISFEGPKGCIAHGTCSNLITFGEIHNERPKKDEAVVEILGSSKYWIALGISKDPYVGRDTLIECLHSGMLGDQVIHFNTYLKSRTEIRRIDEGSFSYGIAKLIHAHIDSADRMYCKFYIKHKFVNPISEETFSLKEFKHYFYILEGQEGRAKMLVGNKAGFGWLVPLKEEDITSFHLTKVPFNVGLRNLPYPNEEEHLTEHRKIMIVLFGLLVPTEWAFIRYFPFALLTRLQIGPFRYQAWYYVFHILNTLIVGLIAYGFMELDPALSEWLPVEARNPYHSATGHMAGTMFIVLLFAFFYHAQWNSKKPNGGHTLVKATVFLGYFLGTVTMEHVKWIKHSGATCYTGSLHRWWIFISVVYHLLMSTFQYWIGTFIKLTKIQKKQLVTIGRMGALYQYGPQFKNMPGLKVRWFLFVIYIGMGGLFSYLMIGSIEPGHTCVADSF